MLATQKTLFATARRGHAVLLLLMLAGLCMLDFAAGSGVARAAVTNPFSDSDSGSYLVSVCDDPSEVNPFTWNGATPVTNDPAPIGGSAQLSSGGCSETEGAADDGWKNAGLVVQGIAGDTASTTGPTGYWSFTAPSGEEITGLQYTGGASLSYGGDGLVAGWFAELAGNPADAGGLAADHDPTQTYDEFEAGTAPTYDCIMATAPASGESCVNDPSGTETFTFNQNPLANGTWSTEVADGTVPSHPALQELALGIECRTGSCTYHSVQDETEIQSGLLQIEDPTSEPASSANLAQFSVNTLVPTGQNGWVSGASLDDANRDLEAQFETGDDDGGICSLQVGLYNSSGTSMDVVSRGTTLAVDSNGYFQSSTPCGTTHAGTLEFAPSQLSTNLSQLPSGTYYLNAMAQDPPEYQQGVYDWYDGGQTASGTTDPTDDGTPLGTVVQIDNSTPSVTVRSAASSGSWVKNTPTLTVSASDSYSGLASLSCTDQVSGTTVATWSSSALGGDPDNDQETIPAGFSGVSGVNTISCTATSAAGETSTGQTVVDVDNITPNVSVNLNADDSGWLTSDPSDIMASAVENPSYSGISDVSCTVTPLDSNDNAIPSEIATQDLGANGGKLSASDFSNGTNDIECTATTGTGVQATSTIAVVTVDTTAPTLRFPLSDSLPPSGQWVQSQSDVEVDAQEPFTGVQAITCTIDNASTGSTTTISPSVTGVPDSAQADSLNTGAYITIPGSELTNGANSISCVAQNGAGTWTPSADALTATIQIDGQTPSTALSNLPQTGIVLQSAPSDVTVTGTEPSSLSGVASSTCTITPNGANQGQTVTIAGATGTIPAADLVDGVNRISCFSTTNAGVSNSSAAGSQSPAVAEVDVESGTPALSMPVASGWYGGAQTVTVSASMTAAADQQFGVKSISCQVNGGAWTTVSGSSETIVVAGEGTVPLDCYAVSDSGVQSPTEASDYEIDSNQPALTSATVQNGPTEGATWTNTPQTITFTYSAPDDRPAPAMKEIDCILGGQELPSFPAQNTTGPATPHEGLNGITVSGDDSSETVTYTVGGDLSGDLTCQGEDQAGVQSASSNWPMFVDTSPPTGSFEDLDSSSDPTEVQFVASDGGGSGVKNVELYVEGTANGNVPLENQSYDPTTGVASGDVPDDGSIANGTYTLMAVVSDYAGNSAQITTDSDGNTAIVSLPLRTVTDVTADVTAGDSTETAVASVAQVGSIAKACPRGESGTVKRVVVRRANRKKHITEKTRLERVCEKVIAKAKKTLKLNYGEGSTVTGELIAKQKAATPSGPTTENVPVTGAKIVVEQTPAYSSTSTVIGSTTTGVDGRFTYRIPGGPSRTLTFLYNGTAILRTSSAKASEEVDGSSSLAVPRRMVHGHRVTLRGVVKGGHIPPGGAQLQLWYTVKGSHVPFAPWATNIHTNSLGRWRFSFALAPYTKGHTYEFEVRVPNQYGWAFLTTTSRVVTRQIR